MTDRDGGPAFPQSDLSGYGMGPAESGNGGMTLRDWFAGQALAGLMPVCQHDTIAPGTWPQHIARNAYEVADAMLAARDAEAGK